MSPIQEHSKKPEETRDRIVQLIGDLPRIELFARQHADGWDCWRRRMLKRKEHQQMTNAEKYLKEGVDVETFVREYLASRIYELDDWLNTPITPTLTEDERVILRNIDTKMWNTILRENGEITFAYKLSRGYRSLGRCEWFSHLFQFIKERRRILCQRIIRR